MSARSSGPASTDGAGADPSRDTPRVAVFAPNPLLSVTIEARGGSGEGDDIHVHAAGQGVWLSRMAAEMGAEPTLCGLIGGETGVLLRSVLERLPLGLCLVSAASASGSYVFDRRSGERRLVSQARSAPASRHEVDDLVAATCAAALESRVLAVCNPFPGDAIPLEVYPSLISDAGANGVFTLVDLSSPRLDSALEGRPDLVKVNDWELAEFIRGPVATPQEITDAAQSLRERGARTALVTRAEEPALVFSDEGVWELAAPRFTRGSREGCGDTMMGGIAAACAKGMDLRQALVLGAAAGATNYLRHGLGTGSRQTVEKLAARVTLRPLPLSA